MKIKTNIFAGFGKFRKRQDMVARQLKANGIRDKRVLDAFLTIPRHLFISEDDQEKAYRDTPVSIGYHQTISQPYVVALMLEELQLKPRHRILEIGSGSGYACALLSLLVDRVTGIELEKDLVTNSIRAINELELKNVRIYQGDGYNGYAKQAPYDAILLSAAPPEIPENLFKQLKPSGKLMLPVGEDEQYLEIWEMKDGEWNRRIITEVRFVPLRHKG
ncbi:MAG: protein-L-isoaspartate(D-aspartate) O-methyltransferase [Candidatus Marinimicrobia bacterium]|nr:protein-L-isoaspartate(D-aspartate) O-methyltransferase [Candidatus Neomarinimicrobiota bacterium]